MIEQETKDEPLPDEEKIGDVRMLRMGMLYMRDDLTLEGATSKSADIMAYSPEYWRDWFARDRVREKLHAAHPEFWNAHPEQRAAWDAEYSDAVFYRENFRRIAAGELPF